MALITEQELYKLAKLSCIKLTPDEVGPLRDSLEAVLQYASRLKDVADRHPNVTLGQQMTNVFRQDLVVPCQEPLVEQAVVHENNYFVVPVIIKQS